MSLSRRAALVSALALAACGKARATPPEDVPPLKSVAPFPVGVAAMTGQFDDLGWSELVRTHFDRVTPEWEMKAEAVLTASGGFDFTRPDRLVTAAAQRGLKVFGHTLIWYAEPHPSFERIADRAPFEAAYARYVETLAGRWSVDGWDVVNEAVDDDGELRDCLWRQRLGDAYVPLAFRHARAATDAPLLLNDYDLERRPRKRAGFLRLAERLLKSGAPLTGLGTQTHVPADLEPGAITAAIRDLAGLGLPVHVSELDVGIKTGALTAFRLSELLDRQARLVAEAVEAVMALPERQRFGVTVWGARDSDSWLRRGAEDRGPVRDAPLLFDDQGRPKPAARAFAKAAG